jgi:hypothetical protein
MHPSLPCSNMYTCDPRALHLTLPSSYLVSCSGVMAKVGRTNLCTDISESHPPQFTGVGVPVAVVDSRLRAKQLLLPRLVRQVPSHLIAVFFGLQRGNEVYPRPHLLACEFAEARQPRSCFT